MTQERWNSFTKNQQLLMIGSEIMRAKIFQKKDSRLFLGTIERAFPLIDFCLEDPKWQDDRYVIITLREELGKFRAGKRTDPIEILYQNL